MKQRWRPRKSRRLTWVASKRWWPTKATTVTGTGGIAGSRGAHIYSGEEAKRPSALGGKRRAAASCLRQSTAVATEQGEAATAPAGRVDRTQFRPLLRDRRHAPYTLTQAQQHSQAFADSCGGGKSGAVAKKEVRKWNTAEPPGALAYSAILCGSDRMGISRIKVTRSSARQ